MYCHSLALQPSVERWFNVLHNLLTVWSLVLFLFEMELKFVELSLERSDIFANKHRSGTFIVADESKLLLCSVKLQFDPRHAVATLASPWFVNTRVPHALRFHSPPEFCIRPRFNGTLRPWIGFIIHIITFKTQSDLNVAL